MLSKHSLKSLLRLAVNICFRYSVSEIEKQECVENILFFNKSKFRNKRYENILFEKIERARSAFSYLEIEYGNECLP